jgi:hypothetical protein
VRPENVELKGSTNPQKRARVIRTNLEAPIIRLASRLANDQILRLKSRTSGRNVILQLAQDVTAETDRKVQGILDERTAFQFSVSKLNDIDINVSGAVDFYETETSKLKTCISTRKATAIEQYDREIADLDKQKKELVTSKTFEVQRNDQNQNNQNNKYKSYTDIDALQIEIDRLVKAEKALASKSPQKGSEQYKQLSNIRNDLGQARNRMNILKPKQKTGGQRHRFTVRQRQPRRFHGY